MNAKPPTSPFTRYIDNEHHYDEVIARFATVDRSLWIGTADLKDVYVKSGANAIPLLGILDKLVKRNVEIRLLHAKEPGPAFQDDFDRYPSLIHGMERALCPRVHFKIIVFDFETAYIGSANMTGAGIGMKSNARRNFEAGILTTDPVLVSQAIEQFDAVWRGAYCQKCGRKKFCADRIK